MKLRHWLGLLLLPLWIGTPAPGGTAQSPVSRYRITDLGTLGGDGSTATGLNDRGQVVGYGEIEPGTGVSHAFLWEKGRMRDLGSLGGERSYARGINRHGDVVGSAEIAPDVEHAVLWKNRKIRDLGVLPGGGYSGATGINDRGEIVGLGDNVIANRFGYFEVTRSFIWKSGKLRMLDDLDSRPGPGEGSSYASAINNRGVVVGEAERIRGEAASPVIWLAGSTHRILPVVQREGWAYALNDVDQVVGRIVNDSDSFPEMEAYVWKNGHLQKLPSLTPELNSVALGINRRGQIVGSAVTPMDELRAVLWEGDAVTDLNELIPEDSDWILEEATAINRSGQIVGSGRHGESSHAFLLTPR